LGATFSTADISNATNNHVATSRRQEQQKSETGGVDGQ
jgi:hypothetical protein